MSEPEFRCVECVNRIKNTGDYTYCRTPQMTWTKDSRGVVNKEHFALCDKHGWREIKAAHA